MSLLHIVNKSPFANPALQSCLAHMTEAAALLLIEDGVYAALASSPLALAGRKVYALGPDLAARGLSARPLQAGLTVVDYAGFVDLCTTHSATQSWF